MRLSDKQLHFLKKELFISKDDICSMTKKQWHEVREKCLDIEVEEAIKEERGGEVDWERCNTAVSILDLDYFK